MNAAHKVRARSQPGSFVPVSSQIFSGGFCSSALSILTIASLSHQTDGDIAISRVKTFGNHKPSESVSKPPSDDPPSPVNSASGRVRYCLSMYGFNSSIKNRAYLRAQPLLRFLRFAFVSITPGVGAYS